MIEKKKLEELLGELLEKVAVSEFNMHFIATCTSADEFSIRKVHNLLANHGFSNEDIAIHAALLGRNPENVEHGHQILKRIGLTDSKIVTLAQLLGKNPERMLACYGKLEGIGLTDRKIAAQAALLSRDPEIIERNYNLLKKYGVKENKIATHANLLGRDPETIERNCSTLKKLGLKDNKIATHPSLLGRDPESIEKSCQNLRKLGLTDKKITERAELLENSLETIQINYQHHVGLLRQNYRDRCSGRDLLVMQAQLLGVSNVNLDANVQFLHNIGIDYCDNAILTGTKVSTKRKKMAWLLREVFDYRNADKDKKGNVIDAMYAFARDNPRVLAESISSLEGHKDYLIKRAA
jgi:hypothetical protein